MIGLASFLLGFSQFLSLSLSLSLYTSLYTSLSIAIDGMSLHILGRMTVRGKERNED
jgi:hypothetical protein